MRKTLSPARLLLNEAIASLILLISFWAILGSLNYTPVTLWGGQVNVWTRSSWPFLLLLVPFIPITLFILKREYGLTPNEAGLCWKNPDSPSPRPGLFFIKVCLAGLILIFLVANILALLGATGIIIRVTDMVSYVDRYNIRLIFLPFWEEFIIRGVICTFVARRLGWWPAVLVSGTVFLGIHLYGYGELQTWVSSGLPSLFFLVFDSYFLSWLYYRTRVLWVPTLWHMAVNILALVLITYPESSTWIFRLITPA